jgi:hypothetical protein
LTFPCRKAERIAEQVEQALDLEPQSLTAPPGSPGKKTVSTVSFDDDPLAALRPPAGPIIAGTAKAVVSTCCISASLEVRTRLQ